MMSYLSNDKSFNPKRLLFDFTVTEYHVGKQLALTFKSTDGFKTINKQIKLEFVRERVAINQPPKWSDQLFRGFKDG